MYSPHSGAPIDARMIGTVAATRLEAASLIPHGGGAVAILIGAIFVAVAVGIVGIELRRNQYLWMLAGFVAALVLISLIHAAVAA